MSDVPTPDAPTDPVDPEVAPEPDADPDDTAD